MPSLLRHSGLLILADRGLLFHQDETLARVVLAEDTVVDGVPCAGGEEIEFHRSGLLASGTLACDAAVRGLPARTGSPLGFYDDGSARFLVLARARRVHGFPAAAGSLFLHPDGSVANALTASTTVFDGVELAAGTRLTASTDGRLLEFWQRLQVDTELQGVPCSARFPVWRWRDGTLSCLHLARPCVLEGRRLPWETEVLLERDGTLRATRRRRYPRGGTAPWRVFGADESPLLAGAA
jgi:hypothetical protein